MARVRQEWGGALPPLPNRSFIDAEQQRADVRSSTPGLGPAADHELLLERDLELSPIRCALARVVERIGSLCDYAFPPFLLRTSLEGATVTASHLADADEPGSLALRTKQTLESRTSFD
jgi:hypothetical protein